MRISDWSSDVCSSDLWPYRRFGRRNEPRPASHDHYARHMREELDPERYDSAAQGEVLRVRAFAYFWSAATIRALGGAIAGVGFQVLIVTVMKATPIQLSVLSALGVAPHSLSRKSVVWVKGVAGCVDTGGGSDSKQKN